MELTAKEKKRLYDQEKWRKKKAKPRELGGNELWRELTRQDEEWRKQHA